MQQSLDVPTSIGREMITEIRKPLSQTTNKEGRYCFQQNTYPLHERIERRIKNLLLLHTIPSSSQLLAGNQSSKAKLRLLASAVHYHSLALTVSS